MYGYRINGRITDRNWISVVFSVKTVCTQTLRNKVNIFWIMVTVNFFGGNNRKLRQRRGFFTNPRELTPLEVEVMVSLHNGFQRSDLLGMPKKK